MNSGNNVLATYYENVPPTPYMHILERGIEEAIEIMQ